MPDPIVRHAKFKNWSGPWIRGSRAFKPDAADPDDIVLAAVAVPEGGCFDTIVAYDGTAMTCGLFQWTLTSGRLQRLLAEMRKAMPYLFQHTVGALLDTRGLELDDKGELFICAGEAYFLLADAPGLRRIFTPPAGNVPRSGKAWIDARASALAFRGLFADQTLDRVQLDFFADELERESKLPRPCLGGDSIHAVLKMHLCDEESTILQATAVRALFWSCWQNSPRKAEKFLLAASRAATKIGFGPLPLMVELSRRIAHTDFARWGIEKAKAGGYTARYTKIARTVNALIGLPVLPGNPR